ncbi:unnamed protein product [Mytilus coruscus]|uniref:MICOS complex subunit n=1 Tax=Mytilus coruscus TaxID=42192 RepID=A0A6J8E5S9_MYTCO|nr:unnamed protein product [Mytilus coruscus]
MVFPTVFAENNTESKKVKVSEKQKKHHSKVMNYILVTEFRKSLFTVLDSFKETTDTIKDKLICKLEKPWKIKYPRIYNFSSIHLILFKNIIKIFNCSYQSMLKTIEYIQNDPGILPRAGVITVAGLGGIVLGHRGGILRKLFYSSFAVLKTMPCHYGMVQIKIKKNKIGENGE